MLREVGGNVAHTATTAKNQKVMIAYLSHYKKKMYHAIIYTASQRDRGRVAHHHLTGQHRHTVSSFSLFNLKFFEISKILEGGE